MATKERCFGCVCARVCECIDNRIDHVLKTQTGLHQKSAVIRMKMGHTHRYPLNKITIMYMRKSALYVNVILEK